MTSTAIANPISFGVSLAANQAQAIETVTAALKQEGFGVLTTIDVKATLKEKLDAEFRPYTILGACNPTLAYQALSTDLVVGTLLPCNVVVYELEPGRSRVEFIDPLAALEMLGNEHLRSLALDAEERLMRVAESIDNPILR